MKQNLLMVTLVGILSCSITYAGDWSTNGLLILDSLRDMTEKLSGDAAVFDSISQEIDHLVSIITTQDAGEQDLISKLGIQFTDLIQAYQNILLQQQNVQIQNAAALQQLKITLASVQSTLQTQIDQLNLQNSAAQALLQQLTNQYSLAVADNQQEATDLLSILRSVSDAYMIMIQEKRLSLEGLNGILNALSNHIANATAGFNQLNMIINQ
ncbi:MAG TPA: hypothetical protein VL201_01775 [Patescibacteria group bacterium]|jgi:hypothetical protein|nr:hypothetical protein [Patescibacteria group bacterium]